MLNKCLVETKISLIFMKNEGNCLIIEPEVQSASKVIAELDALYFFVIGIKPSRQELLVQLLVEYGTVVGDSIADDVRCFLVRHPYLPDIIKRRYTESLLYQQSGVLLLYWLLKKKKCRLLANWPLPMIELQSFAVDLGVSLVDW